MRIWFNKTFSSIISMFENIKKAKRREDVTVIYTHTNPSTAPFLIADESMVEPARLAGEDYLEWCLNFCKEHRIDYFCPAKESILIVEHQSDFASIGTRVVAVSTLETLTLLNNKGAFYRTLPAWVARTMETIAVNDKIGFDNAVATLLQRHKTLCVKPSVSVFGLGFRILDTKTDSITHLLDGVEYTIPLAELRLGMEKTSEFSELLVMEYLDGVEWSVDCVGVNGKLLCAVQRKKHPKAGYGQEIDNHPDICGMVERLSAFYTLNGVFNIQFRANTDGTPYLLEINPRPSGGFGMACLAGVNLAEVFLQTLRGEPIVIPPLHYGLRIGEIKTSVVLPIANQRK